MVPILPSNTPVIFTQYCACNFCHGKDHDDVDDDGDGDGDDGIDDGDVDNDDIECVPLTSNTWEQSVRK